jgi:toxin ParE1/3/4
VNYRVIYAAAARADLREIVTYFRDAAGDAIAKAIAEKIIEAAESLSTMPTRQRMRNALHPGLRSLSVGNYMIFYRVQERTVSVVRILHGARDISADLFSDPRSRS